MHIVNHDGRTPTSSLPDGQVITQRSTDTSYIMVSDIGLLRSDIVTCRLCFSVDLDVSTFIFPSALDIDGGYAANSKTNTSFKVISRELASIIIAAAILGFLIENGPSPISTFGCADGNRVQIYVSITNTEGVISILML